MYCMHTRTMHTTHYYYIHTLCTKMHCEKREKASYKKNLHCCHSSSVYKSRNRGPSIASGTLHTAHIIHTLHKRARCMHILHTLHIHYMHTLCIHTHIVCVMWKCVCCVCKMCVLSMYSACVFGITQFYNYLKFQFFLLQ